MDEVYVIEVYSDRKSLFLEKNFTKKNEYTYIYKGTYSECVRLLNRARWRNFKAVIFKDRYNRNSNYRKAFFDSRPDDDSFRCVYCGKIVPKQYVTVDHVVPVHHAKRYASAKLALKLKGCDSVNDIGNLVPSCFKCNKKKGSDYNIVYVIRSIYGENKLYWDVIHTLRLLLFVIMAAVIILYILRRQYGVI